MKYLLIIMFLLNLVSCGSTQFNDPIASVELKANNLKQEDKILGDDLPDWVNQEGVHNGYIYVIGEHETAAGIGQSYVLESAKVDAEMQIISRMPASYKMSLSKILNENQIDKLERSFTKKISVNGLSEIIFNRRKQTCRKKITHSDFGEDIKIICYVQSKIALSVYNRILQKQLDSTFSKKIDLPSELKQVAQQ